MKILGLTLTSAILLSANAISGIELLGQELSDEIMRPICLEMGKEIVERKKSDISVLQKYKQIEVMSFEAMKTLKAISEKKEVIDLTQKQKANVLWLIKFEQKNNPSDLERKTLQRIRENYSITLERLNTILTPVKEKLNQLNEYVKENTPLSLSSRSIRATSQLEELYQYSSMTLRFERIVNTGYPKQRSLANLRINTTGDLEYKVLDDTSYDFVSLSDPQKTRKEVKTELNVLEPLSTYMNKIRNRSNVSEFYLDKYLDPKCLQYFPEVLKSASLFQEERLVGPLESFEAHRWDENKVFELKTYEIPSGKIRPVVVE